MLLRHVPFLKAVALYSFTAFGGPQGHYGMMLKTFVQKRRDVTEEELLEYNTFCQILPGPSSTQTVMLIALKRGGIPLAIITLGLWILPAVIIMTALSFLLTTVPVDILRPQLFVYVQPMSVGFVFFAALRMMQVSVKYKATWAIMLASLAATFLIRSPWVFPGILILAGFASNFSSNRIPAITTKPKAIRWLNLWLFAALFVGAGVLSELARTQDWNHRRVFHLFENFFRFGSIVFGGGQALLAMMLYQFVKRPAAQSHPVWISAENLLTGYGLVQAVPGPVFSMCAFTGGLALSSQGPMWQLAGALIATVAVFLPSTLMLFFFFPIYHNLKQHVIIYRALEGIHAAVVGIIWASGLVLLQSIWTPDFHPTDLIVIIITFCLLQYTKVPAPLIVLAWLLLGWSMNGI